MSRNKKPTTTRVIRCAIYTRKSSEEGLELEFNSLDAQRESAEAFIASQQHEGWVCLPEHYDDGGFSGVFLQKPFDEPRGSEVAGLVLANHVKFHRAETRMLTLV